MKTPQPNHHLVFKESLNSLTCKSLHNCSIPSASIASSMSSLYCSKSAFNLLSDGCLLSMAPMTGADFEQILFWHWLKILIADELFVVVVVSCAAEINKWLPLLINAVSVTTTGARAWLGAGYKGASGISANIWFVCTCVRLSSMCLPSLLQFEAMFSCAGGWGSLKQVRQLPIWWTTWIRSKVNAASYCWGFLHCPQMFVTICKNLVNTANLNRSPSKTCCYLFCNWGAHRDYFDSLCYLHKTTV